MDFGSAALLSFAVFLTVAFVLALLPNTMSENVKIKLLVVILVGQGITQVVAHSDWGSKQVVEGLSLNNMNIWSLILVGLAVAGLAAIANKLVTYAIPNIGQNQT